jgi:rhodanese-related sulfurtransferase
MTLLYSPLRPTLEAWPVGCAKEISMTTPRSSNPSTPVSQVLAVLPEGGPGRAAQEFAAKLAYATDPDDLAKDLEAGIEGLVVIDARTKEAYERGHVPGALNFPHREMNERSTAHLDKGKVYVTYCDGIGCNASTKGAYNLARLGFQTKEMLGGLDWWIRDGYAVAVGSGVDAISAQKPGTPIQCGC